MTTSCSNYCMTCCPEPVSCTINEYEVTTSGVTVPALSFTRDFETQGTLSIQIQSPEGGALLQRFTVLVWFQDTDVFGDPTTLIPPTSPGSQSIEVQTDALGVGTLSVNNTGVSRTWYVFASVGGVLCTASAEATVGTS